MIYYLQARGNLKKLLAFSIIGLIFVSILTVFPSHVFGANENLSVYQTSNSYVYSINWTLNNSPIYIENDITINNTTKLNIEPGVNVLFNSSYYLRIDGYLNASGTQEKSINFTSNSTIQIPGDWVGLQFGQEGDGIIEHCNINYTSTGIEINSNNQILIKNNSINYASEFGISVTNSTVMLQNNLIQYIGKDGIRIHNSNQSTINENIIINYTI